MQLEHSFTVPVPVEVAWEALLDPERVAPCFPGATLTGVDGPEFTGTVKVRMGPVSLTYKGTGRFTSSDVSARRVILEATGKDSRGNGTASATVTATVAEAESGSGSRVDVLTDLTITGRPAQLGRGLIGEIGGKIIDAFAQCLAENLSTPSEAAMSDNGTTAANGTTSSAADGVTDSAADGVTGSVADGVTDPAAGSATGPAATGPAVTGPAAAEAERAAAAPAAESAAIDAAAATDPAAPAPAAAVGQSAPGRTTRAEPDVPKRPTHLPETADTPGNEIDLLDFAGRPVAKRVAPVVVGLAVLVLVVRWLRRR